MDALKGLLQGSTIGLDSFRAEKFEKLNKDIGAVSNESGDKQVKKAATEFESMLLHQMLNSMWSTVPKDSLFGGGQETEIYRDMYTDAIAKDISEKQSLGIKDVVFKELSKK